MKRPKLIDANELLSWVQAEIASCKNYKKEVRRNSTDWHGEDGYQTACESFKRKIKALIAQTKGGVT